MRSDGIEETETVKGLVIKIPLWNLFRPRFAKMWSVGLGITPQLMKVGKQILDHAILHMTHDPKQATDESARSQGGKRAEPKSERDDRTGFEKAIEEGVSSIDWEAVGESLKTEVDKVDWEDVGKGLEEFAQSIECKWTDVKIKRKRPVPSALKKPTDEAK